MSMTSERQEPERGALERAARLDWVTWGAAWAMHTRCAECGEVCWCRGRRRERMLCLACFDLKGGR
jgi:hypothetical protein